MSSNVVKLSNSFQILLESVKDLSLKEKRRLRKLLNTQIEQAEAEEAEHDPQTQAEIQAARNAFQAGDYITMEEYLTQRNRKVE